MFVDDNSSEQGFLSDLSIVLVSQDSFLQIATQSIVGRDRRSRIYHMYSSIEELIDGLSSLSANLKHILIVDFGFFGIPNFPIEKLEAIHSHVQHLRIIGLLDKNNQEIEKLLRYDLFDAIVQKDELGPVIHLLAQACYKTENVIITHHIGGFIRDGSVRQYTIIPSMQAWERELQHLQLTSQQIRIFIMRILAGLDFSDVSDELMIAPSTLKGHMRSIFECLESKEMHPSKKIQEMFKELSEWWWEERFQPYI